MTLFIDQTVLWYREGNVWYMTEAYTNVYVDGDTLSIWTSNSGQIASINGSPLRTLKNMILAPTSLAAIPFKALAPQPLEAQYWSCRHQWLAYLGGALVAKLAVGAAIAAPNPGTIEAAIVAVAVAIDLGEQLVDCMVEHG